MATVSPLLLTFENMVWVGTAAKAKMLRLRREPNAELCMQGAECRAMRTVSRLRVTCWSGRQRLLHSIAVVTSIGNVWEQQYFRMLGFRDGRSTASGMAKGEQQGRHFKGMDCSVK